MSVDNKIAAAGSSRPRPPLGQRQYVRHSQLPVGEDRRREFKGHRNLSHEEVPQKLQHSRRSVSRNINGFLNTGEGGKIYLGILDDGTVSGIPLSEAQKDHVTIALDDLMGRYTPPVPHSVYHLSFVPVAIDQSNKKEHDDSGVGMDLVLEEGAAAAVSCSRDTTRGMEVRGHLLRCSLFCWCDREARDKMSKGEPSLYYIVEISILPFRRDPMLPPMVLQLHPIYQNEQGCVYFRGSTALQQYTYQLIAKLTTAEVNEHFDKIKKKLKEEIRVCMTRLTSALANLAQQQSCDSHMTKNLLPPLPHQPPKHTIGLASL